LYFLKLSFSYHRYVNKSQQVSMHSFKAYYGTYPSILPSLATHVHAGFSTIIFVKSSQNQT